MRLFNYTKKDMDERAAELNFVANTQNDIGVRPIILHNKQML